MDIVANEKHSEIIGVRTVRVLKGYRVALTFTDGTQGELDLEPYLWGPVFEPLKQDKKLFRAVSVDDDAQTIVWPNGADIAPETLYEDSRPVKPGQNRLREKKTVRAVRMATSRAER